MNQEVASTVSEVITNTGSILAAFYGKEEFAEIFTVFSPIVRRGIERTLSNIGAGRFSEREMGRIGTTLRYAAKVIQEHIDNGDTPKMNFGQSRAQEAAEAILRASAEDSQEKKEAAFGAFIGNYSYQDEFDDKTLFMFSSILKNLSFDEMLLIAALYTLPPRNFEPVVIKFRDDGDSSAAELTHYFIHLRDLALTVRTKPFSTGATIGTLKLSSLGSALCRLAGLDKLEPESHLSLRSNLMIYSHEPDHIL